MEAVSAGAELLRRIYPRVLARAVSFTRSLPEAEDAVQEAVLRALATWPERGAPESPEAWLLTVATNAHRDRVRKGKWESPQHDALEELAHMSPWARIAVGAPDIARGWKDELLRLVFACCHPALEPGEGAALCLATVIGLSTREIALAFVTEPRSMEQRLTRARRRLRERGHADGGLPEQSMEQLLEQSPRQSIDRLEAVLRVLHLLFNEGYWSSDEAEPIRADLCRLALGLAHSLADAFPDQPEALALLALLMLHDARRSARTSGDGAPVPLPEQDRSRWDRAAIGAAISLLDRALSVGRRGPFQLEAAIAAVHCRAAIAADTDWKQIAELYAALEELRPTPAVRVNRAMALGKAAGAAAGLALLEDRAIIDAFAYPYAHLVQGTLLSELGRVSEARTSLREARRAARNRAEAAQIDQLIAELEANGAPE